LKSEELKASLDFLTKLEANLCANVIADFNMLSGITLYSDKCGPKEMQRLEDAHRRGNRKATIFDFINKQEGPTMTISAAAKID
jgi:hypothetical protein